MSRKWDAYVINLETAPERWTHMQNEFKDTPLNLIRWPCQKSTMETDPEFKKLCIVFEDDAFRTQDKDTFSKRIIDIFTYLEQHTGTFSHFQGGGVYPIPSSIESQDPLLIRCNYITCTTFTVFGKDAANSVFDYEKNIDTVKDPIDNYIGQQNREKILAPFPELVWQIIGLASNISSADQKVTLNEAFRNSHKVMLDFVRSKGVNTMSGGRRKIKSKTLSFLKSAIKRSKKHKAFLIKTRKSYRNAKAV
jgi:hypothetical protein